MRNKQVLTLLPLCIIVGLIHMFLAGEIQENIDSPGSCGPIENTDGRCIKIGSKFYIHQDQRKENWFSAVHSCLRLNRNLLTIDNRVEMIDISKYLKGRYYDYFNNVPNNTYDVLRRVLDMTVWTAGNDLAADEQYYSIATGRTLPYVFFGERKKALEHCITLGFDYYNERVIMEGENCKNIKFHYMCETAGN